MHRQTEEISSVSHTAVNIPTTSTTNNLNDGGESSALTPSRLISTRREGAARRWPTIDGPLGLSEEDSIGQAGNFFKLGFLLLPWLWAVNCFYFWPVLTKPTSRSHPRLRYYVVGSAIGFTVFTVLLSSWALTFAIGGKHLFGDKWDELVMYNVAEKYGLTGWI